MSPEHVELWARKFNIKRGQRLALWLFVLEDLWWCWGSLRFPTDSILGGKELQAQPRLLLSWQRVAGLLFFGCSRGNEL